MSDNRIEINRLTSEVEAILNDFIDAEQSAINKEIKQAGKAALKELKTETPSGAGKFKDWDEYQAGWRMKNEVDALGNNTVIIGNAKKPGLTHLLEEGHILAGGRGRAKAFPHIQPVAERAFDDLKRRLNGGV